MTQTVAAPPAPAIAHDDHLRFHNVHIHLASPFGAGGFGRRAESFARFFGTPTFLIGQTLVVASWIVLNAVGVISWDVYPFILLNLGFSLQAAYAAPLILLAQTRQADRDKAHADADARHREELSRVSLERQASALKQATAMAAVLDTNTALTEEVRRLTETVAHLTEEVHRTICPGSKSDAQANS